MARNIAQSPQISTAVPAGLAAVVTRLNNTLDDISAHEGTIDAASVVMEETKHEILLLAMAAGDDLNAIKDAVGHGNFGPWLKKNFARTPRTATKYMELADGRDIIDAKIGTGSVLSITSALKLLRGPKVKKDPYSPEALSKLSPEKRAQLRADLNATTSRTEVPAAVTAEIVQHAVAQAQREAKKIHGVRAQCIEDVRAALATNAPPAHQNETIRALLDTFDRRTAREENIRDRLAPESFFLNKPTSGTALSVSSPLADNPTVPTKH